MSELFLENGHLSNEGLKALIQGTLNETSRLEAAEHLSFCDECLVRYTDLFVEDVQVEPEQSVTLPVMRRLRQRTVKVLVSRYTAAAAAVMIAGTLWYSGVLTGAAEAFATRTPQAEPQQRPAVTDTEGPKIPQNALTGAINGWLAGLRPAPQQKPAQNDQQTDPAKPEATPGADQQAKPEATPAPTAKPQATPQPQGAKAPRDFSISKLLNNLFGGDPAPEA